MSEKPPIPVRVGVGTNGDYIVEIFNRYKEWQQVGGGYWSFQAAENEAKHWYPPPEYKMIERSG